MTRSILFVVPRFHTNLAGAVRALDGSGHRVAVFAQSSRSDEDHSLIVPWTFGDDPDPRAVAKALDDVAPDLILLRKSGALTRIVAKHANKRRIRMLDYSLWPADRRLGWTERLKKFLTEMPSERVTPVPGRGGARDPRAHLLPWPVFGDPVATPLPRQADAVSILCVGKLVQKRKNQDRLVDALDAIPDAPPWRLTLVGSDTRDASGVSADHLRNLERRAADSVPGRAVTIRANVPFRDMSDIYRAHDICVLPASDERLGMAPLEAMAFGCIPVISHDAGAAGFVRDAQTGLLIDPDDPASLRQALATLLNDADLRARLSRAAHDAALVQFGPRAFLQKFDALFDDWAVTF